MAVPFNERYSYAVNNNNVQDFSMTIIAAKSLLLNLLFKSRLTRFSNEHFPLRVLSSSDFHSGRELLGQICSSLPVFFQFMSELGTHVDLRAVNKGLFVEHR